MTIITITGTPGSGKSTIAQLLAKRLGYKHYSMGDLQRKLALKHGMSLAELQQKNLEGEFTDKEVDEYQTKLGEEEDSFVIDSRLGFHFIPESIKLFVDANEELRAKRLLERESVAERAESLEHAISLNRERVENEKLRYQQKYGIHPYRKEAYDLILDTTGKQGEEMVEEILAAFPELQQA